MFKIISLWQTYCTNFYCTGIIDKSLSFLFFISLLGYIVLFISIMYPLRAVNSLWLFKGGKEVGLITHAPFGKKLTHVTPLENISCVQSRAQAQTQVPIKVKHKWFFYLLDKKGVFHNPELFDYMVGLRRNLK